jgi:hypothetical protein
MKYIGIAANHSGTVFEIYCSEKGTFNKIWPEMFEE